MYRSFERDDGLVDTGDSLEKGRDSVFSRDDVPLGGQEDDSVRGNELLQRPAAREPLAMAELCLLFLLRHVGDVLEEDVARTRVGVPFVHRVNGL